MKSHIQRVHARLGVTCHLHLWQNDWDLLRATAVTRGWNGYRNVIAYIELNCAVQVNIEIDTFEVFGSKSTSLSLRRLYFSL